MDQIKQTTPHQYISIIFFVNKTKPFDSIKIFLKYYTILNNKIIMGKCDFNV